VRSKIVLAAVLVLVVIGIIIACSSGKDTTPAEKKSAEAPAAGEPEKGEAPEGPLVVEDWGFKAGEFGTGKIVGTVVNNTDREYSYVQIEFNLYDSEGAQVGSTFTNITDLEPHGKWKFEALVLEDNATEAKLKGITAY
jgi:hypothetical protein